MLLLTAVVSLSLLPLMSFMNPVDTSTQFLMLASPLPPSFLI